MLVVAIRLCRKFILALNHISCNSFFIIRSFSFVKTTIKTTYKNLVCAFIQNTKINEKIGLHLTFSIVYINRGKKSPHTISEYIIKMNQDLR